jgi:hypothetical protein
MPPRSRQPAKPTVFLSHSSTNRRELAGLKRLLDERAGGMIEFFLSSDDDSIAHGSVWPAEVRAALDRMSLMLIFVSSEALKSGWTYFEAGYGLHKLGTANIYCLPGSNKAALPSPFNILQNRNLHSAREVSLLIQQVNEKLGGRIDESVTKDAFDRIFRRPLLGQVDSGPPFDQLVESVTISTQGPCDSLDIFSKVCREHRFPVTVPEEKGWRTTDDVVSTGVRLAVDIPAEEELLSDFEITDEMRKQGEADVIEYSNGWQPYFDGAFMSARRSVRSVKEIEAQNAAIREKNESLTRANAKRLSAPRPCTFTVSPINISVAIEIIDHWIAEAKPSYPLDVEIQLRSEAALERAIEAISAKIHGSQISMTENGSLLWRATAVVSLEPAKRRISIAPHEERSLNVQSLYIPDLISTLFTLNVLSLDAPRAKKRR